MKMNRIVNRFYGEIFIMSIKYIKIYIINEIFIMYEYNIYILCFIDGQQRLTTRRYKQKIYAHMQPCYSK